LLSFVFTFMDPGYRRAFFTALCHYRALAAISLFRGPEMRVTRNRDISFGSFRRMHGFVREKLAPN